MPISNNTYNVNWNKLISWLTPTALFKPKMFAWLKALVAPIGTLHTTFLQFRKQKLYELSITPQVYSLENLLNDKFDFIQRRIFITDGQPSKKKYAYQQDEFVVNHIYQDTENKPLYVYQPSELTQPTVHFIVNVPSSLTFDNAVMISILSVFKLPSKKFDIITF